MNIIINDANRAEVFSSQSPQCPRLHERKRGTAGRRVAGKSPRNVGPLASGVLRATDVGCPSAIAGGVFSPAAFASKQGRRMAEEIRSFNSSQARREVHTRGNEGKRTSI